MSNALFQHTRLHSVTVLHCYNRRTRMHALCAPHVKLLTFAFNFFDKPSLQQHFARGLLSLTPMWMNRGRCTRQQSLKESNIFLNTRNISFKFYRRFKIYLPNYPVYSKGTPLRYLLKHGQQRSEAATRCPQRGNTARGASL